MDAYHHRRGDRITAHWASLRDTDVSQRLQRLRILAARQAPLAGSCATKGAHDRSRRRYDGAGSYPAVRGGLLRAGAHPMLVKDEIRSICNLPPDGDLTHDAALNDILPFNEHIEFE